MDRALRLRRLGYQVAYRGVALTGTLTGFRPDGVKCVILDGERLLLVRHTYGPGGWDLPGGGARPGEPAAATATREMAEELGLQVDDRRWRDLGSLHGVGGRHRIAVVGTVVTDPHFVVDPVELADAGWFARDRLPEPAARLRGLVLGASGVTAFAWPDRTDPTHVHSSISPGRPSEPPDHGG